MPPKQRKPRTAHPEIIGQVESEHGYTFLAMAMYKGRRRIYWWHCGGCWQTCEPSPEAADMSDQAAQHLLLCPGQVTAATVSVLPTVHAFQAPRMAA
ncbi:hypothetical protein OIA45_49120 (plasmid) [Streptomyces chartreusis]|uniref:hypothetical protein n=1 Tax=Streptomyces chartreusis TaxID=1969 RepID=UPI00386948FB|nr:hypothetical protein OIA45_49120 [Streptomyces chartreusis]